MTVGMISASSGDTMQRTFNLADLLEIVAESVPDRLAFICGSDKLTFKQLDERATRLASSLRSLGINRGDNVGIELHNCAQYMEAFFACCKIGAAPANVNYRYVAEELQYLLKSLDLKAVLLHSRSVPELAKAATALPTLAHCIEIKDETHEQGKYPSMIDYETLVSRGATTLQDPDRSDNDLYLLCTGGTTGMPKGVMWQHKALFMGALGGGGAYFRRPPISAPEELATLVPSGPGMRFFALAPMMHGAANWASLISLFAGHTVVVNEQHHFDAEHIWDVVDRDQVNIMSVVGDAMAQPLVQALEQHPNRWKLGSLFVLGNGGAALSEGMQVRLKKAIPHINIMNGIGSSETGTLSSAGAMPKDGPGLIVLNADPQLAVLDDSDTIQTRPGATGVLARTGHTPIGYYGDPVKSAATFRTIDGKVWALTGDQARINDEGQIVVLGRGSQCINTGGEKVFPEEVEAAVRQYSVINDVLVVGLPDERWGQRVTAVVELVAGKSFDQTEFERICRVHLAGYKVPKSVMFTDRIRRSPAGKADYRWALEFAMKNSSATPAS